MTTWTHESLLCKGLLKQKKEGRKDLKNQFSRSFGAAYAATSAACSFKLPWLCPCTSCSLECPSLTSSWGNKTLQTRQHFVFCAVVNDHPVISFSFLPEPVLGLCGPRSLHCPSPVLQGRVTSAGCISRFREVS